MITEKKIKYKDYLSELKEEFSDGVVDFSDDSDSLNEAIALCDEAVMEEYLEKII